MDQDGKGEKLYLLIVSKQNSFDLKKCGALWNLQNIIGFIGSAERRANIDSDPK